MQRFAKPYNLWVAMVQFHHHPPVTEVAAKWLAIGLENRGNRKVRGSIPQASAISLS